MTKYDAKVLDYISSRKDDIDNIAAKIGIISGSVLYIISQFWIGPSRVEAALEKAKATGITDPQALRVVEADAYPHFLHIMAILFIANVIIMLIIGKIKPRETPFVLEYTKQVSIEPYKYVKQFGLVICAIVIAIYILFAK